MNVGEYLRMERETKDISLNHVADVTKISPRYLNAIETGKFNELPSPIFTKGFLKAYAKCIGLNPEDIIFRYETSLMCNMVNPAAQIQHGVSKRIFKPKISGRIIFAAIALAVLVLAAVFSSSS